MSATERTQYYGYPLYKENDYTSWADYNSLATGADRDIFNAEAQANAAKAQAEELAGNVGGLSDSVTELMSNVNEMRQSNENLNVRVENVETHLNDVDEKVESLENGANTTSGQIAALENSVSGLEDKSTKNENDIGTLTTRVNNTSDLVGQHGTDIAALKSEVSVLERIQGEHSTDLNRLQVNVAENSADIQQMKNGESVLVLRDAEEARVSIAPASGNSTRFAITATPGVNIFNCVITLGSAQLRANAPIFQVGFGYYDYSGGVTLITNSYAISETAFALQGIIMNENSTPSTANVCFAMLNGENIIKLTNSGINPGIIITRSIRALSPR